MTEQHSAPDEEALAEVEPPRRALLRRALGTGALASLGALGLGMTGLTRAAEGGGAGNFPEHPNWKFVFINHVTTNPFFTATQYGIEDACALLGCSYQWTGSQKSIASEMVNSINAAIAGGADGLAIALVDPNAFNNPVDRALQAGIPVVSYNADVDNHRLAYVGQDLFLAGKALGARIASMVDEGEVAGFIATPGQLNIQPRLDGAKEAIRESGKNIQLREVATGPTINEEVSRVESWYLGHRDARAMFAVDAGSTMAVGRLMQKYNLHEEGVRAGGLDMLPGTLDAINAGAMDFTIDQQPYLQGFYTVLELFLYKMSGGLTGPANINTGLKFVTRETVQPYLETKTRYEGNSRQPQRVERSGPITVE
ncbi:monosaccharide ABC transporter substrate-binding protein (CUT2 family) [Kushneria sinocarnis]|uniref:Monosaccharide ABC transporter substrate-binding protein (CUT2 family) n=1 Tax=Kushneria sinocarnis TaxID=595502 RepID=A0A420WZR4_9GAMM|nr:sugar ABC transporter substrate-binding protein [Kushneria sinocarnis]RKR06782.1 monosaccharide ABC transporter substrate-binding protein (CUT2 family) [Kushneria sinocarnis]